MALSLPPTLNPQRLMAWLSVALVLAAVVWWLAPVLTPFVVAAILAYALQPLVRRLQGVLGVRVPAFVSVVLVELVALLSVLGIVLGTMTFAIVNQGIYYTGFDANWASLIIGVLLLAAVLLNNTFRAMAISHAAPRIKPKAAK